MQPQIAESLLTIAPSPPFDFFATASSHGWVGLEPNAWEAERGAVRRVQQLSSSQVALLWISSAGTAGRPMVEIRANASGGLSPQEQQEILSVVGHMFRIDEDFSEFYKLCEQQGGRWLNLTAGLGRLLRSPTVFEDVVRTICTTNVQWGGTRGMMKRLVSAYGEPYPGDPRLRAFPTSQAIASAPYEEFAGTVRMGYRSPYVLELAQRVAAGDLDLEAYLDPSIPTLELKKKLLAIKGVGNYAAATLLTLLGRYDELAVDTVFRQFVSRKYFEGQTPTDNEARAVYAVWGKWKYLAYWFDIWESYNREK
jgi:3-methyladenine DNA glycosylase/8-oxoguanine DNA glycosylase